MFTLLVGGLLGLLLLAIGVHVACIWAGCG